MTHGPQETPSVRSAWLVALRRYLLAILAGNLVWEMAHLPLYTIWRSGTLWDLTVAVIHCSAGDLIIATTALVLALVVLRAGTWPSDKFFTVAATALAIGMAYTTYSERVNVVVRRTWAYADSMPIVPWLDVGLSPLLQWLIVPTVAFACVHRALKV